MEEALSRYLTPRLGGGQPVTIANLSRIPGGASRETWMFEARYGSSVEHLIVRKDPPASLLETDREAEFAFYQSFAGTAVPVPRMRFIEQDQGHIGGAFFIMDRILDCDGGTRFILEPHYDAARPKIARRLYEILAAIHTFNWIGSPAERFAKIPTTETAWSQELDHWEGVINANELSPQPIVRAGIRWLRANPPPPARQISIVHGDYRVGNFLYRNDGAIVGIVDWEMSHIGDPIEDLAWSFNESWRWMRDARPGGIITREEAIATYEEATGAPVDRQALHWWEVFSDVKCQGIWLTGAKSFQEGRTNELMMPVIAYTLINAQDESLLRALGRGA
ncbi:hypothetical protein AYO38_04060 [bacterium SCGC AG-212-C10]|nr:hypothetical protein AYO38_04060 [bacterium SCGC AG-212-C10]